MELLDYVHEDAEPGGAEWDEAYEAFSPKGLIPEDGYRNHGPLLDGLKELPNALLGADLDEGHDMLAFGQAEHILQSLPGGLCRCDEIVSIVQAAVYARFAVMLSVKPDATPSYLIASLRGSGDFHAIACLAQACARHLLADGSAS
jgi:hypothetical protein